MERTSRARPEPRGSTGVRTCVGCRERAAKSDLLRVVVIRAAVVDVDGVDAVVPDPRGRFPGRGASLHLDLGCLDLAVRRRAFPRAFRRAGQLDVDAVREYLRRVEGRRTTTDTSSPEAGREADEHSMSTTR